MKRAAMLVMVIASALCPKCFEPAELWEGRPGEFSRRRIAKKAGIITCECGCRFRVASRGGC